MGNRRVEGKALDTAPNLGFLTVVQEGGGYYGGYLVTNSWGRPLEFRLSSVVQPNRVQQMLYGPTLRPCICAELIGKTLVEKCATAAQLILTDCDAVLELRGTVPTPIVWLALPDDPLGQSLEQSGAAVKWTNTHVFVCHRKFLEDVATIRDVLTKVDAPDLAEPFARIREALTEARKQGAVSRAA